jgi:hypothetical protein
MDEPKNSRSDKSGGSDKAEEDGTNSNVVLLILFVAVVGTGIWLVNALLDARKADECMTQRRRDCTPITAPAP